VCSSDLASQGARTVDTLTAAKLTTLNATGDNAVVITGGTTTALSSVAASGLTGALTIGQAVDFTSTASVTMGTAADTITLDIATEANVVVDAGEKSGTDVSDTLAYAGANNQGLTVIDLSSSTDQVSQINGVLNSAAQTDFEAVDMSGLTGTFGVNIAGSSEANTITGTANADVITAGAGDDIILGGAGNDTITGGDGADQFRFDANDGSDTVLDFTNGEDLIMLLDGAASNGTAVAFAGSTGTTSGAAMAATDLATFDHDGTTALVASHVNIADDSLTTTEIGAIDLAGATTYLMVMNSTTGTAQLWYDSDWDVTTGGRVLIAEFSGADLDTATEVAALTAADFGTYIM
jgi:hypothetical protein